MEKLRKLKDAVKRARRAMVWMVRVADFLGLDDSQVHQLRRYQQQIADLDDALGRVVEITEILRDVDQVWAAARELTSLGNFSEDPVKAQRAAAAFGRLMQGLGRLGARLPGPAGRLVGILAQPSAASFFTNMQELMAPSTDRARRTGNPERDPDVDRVLSRPR